MLGSVFFQLQESDSAMYWFRKALDSDLQNLAENHVNAADDYANIARTFQMKKEFDSAGVYYQKSLQMLSISIVQMTT